MNKKAMIYTFLAIFIAISSVSYADSEPSCDSITIDTDLEYLVPEMIHRHNPTLSPRDIKFAYTTDGSTYNVTFMFRRLYLEDGDIIALSQMNGSMQISDLGDDSECKKAITNFEIIE